MRTVSIDRRFRGPNRSGNGGYSASLVGREIDGPADVQLRLPPPLDTPLEIFREDGEVIARAGEDVVLVGRPTEIDLEPPATPPLEEIEAAERFWPEELHPFPECFVCGPHREEGDGLRIFPRVLSEDLFADVWSPGPDFAGPDGNVAEEIVWAALDCPTASPTVRLGHPAVLASLAVRIDHSVPLGEPIVVSAWFLHEDGRKRTGAAALQDAEGRLLAISRGLWIEVRDPAAFDSAI